MLSASHLRLPKCLVDKLSAAKRLRTIKHQSKHKQMHSSARARPTAGGDKKRNQLRRVASPSVSKHSSLALSFPSPGSNGAGTELLTKSNQIERTARTASIDTQTNGLINAFRIGIHFHLATPNK